MIFYGTNYRNQHALPLGRCGNGSAPPTGRKRVPCDLLPQSGTLNGKKKKAVIADCLLRAENETRTRDPNLGKVVLYQLSYLATPTLARLCSTN